mgnify:FL=1|tara:strand:+ start:3911 stop:4414 length:504 start_codon:yes stop_codon:yes gene_type:complete
MAFGKFYGMSTACILMLGMGGYAHADEWTYIECNIETEFYRPDGSLRDKSVGGHVVRFSVDNYSQYVKRSNSWQEQNAETRSRNWLARPTNYNVTDHIVELKVDNYDTEYGNNNCPDLRVKTTINRATGFYSSTGHSFDGCGSGGQLSSRTKGSCKPTENPQASRAF